MQMMLLSLLSKEEQRCGYVADGRNAHYCCIKVCSICVISTQG